MLLKQLCTCIGFRHSKNVYVHEKTHTGEKPWGCDVCQKRFICKTQLTAHAITHSSNSYYLPNAYTSTQKIVALQQRVMIETQDWILNVQKCSVCTWLPIYWSCKCLKNLHICRILKRTNVNLYVLLCTYHTWTLNRYIYVHGHLGIYGLCNIFRRKAISVLTLSKEIQSRIKFETAPKLTHRYSY